MAINIAEIETEIAKIQTQTNTVAGKITTALTALDKLKATQKKLIKKQGQLQAAKIRIANFNKAG